MQLWRWAHLPLWLTQHLQQPGNVTEMASAFKMAIEAGRKAYLCGMGGVRTTGEASSPITGYLR